MTDDLDSFIKEQKSRLQQERDSLQHQNPGQDNKPQRKQWDAKPTNVKMAPQTGRLETPDDGGGLPLGGYDERRQKLQEERHREYNQLLAQNTPHASPRRAPDTPDAKSLPLGDNTPHARNQRRFDSQNATNKTPQPPPKTSPRRAFESPERNSLPLNGLGEERKKQLNERRREEYKDHQKAARPVAVRPAGTPEDGGYLLGNLGEERSRKMQEERKKEYQSFLNQQKTPSRKIPEVSSEAPLASKDNERKRLQEERKAEYNEFLQRQQAPNRRYDIPVSEQGLPVGQNEGNRQRLLEERRLEYNQMIGKTKHGGPASKEESHDDRNVQDNDTDNTPDQKHTSSILRKAPPPDLGSLPVGSYGEERKKLDIERKNEYNERISSQKKDSQRSMKENLPPKPPTPDGGLVGKMGQYSRNKKNLDQERKDEYNRMLAEQKVRRTGDTAVISDTSYAAALPASRHQPAPDKQVRIDDEGAVIPGLRDHASAEARKIHQRNQEYNEFLKQKQAAKQRPPLAPPAPPAPLDDSDDEEYRQWLQNRPPRKGWTTPTYEEILEKKRREERAYRRGDDPELYGGMALGGEAYNRAAISDSNIHAVQDEKRFRELDRELRSKKQKLAHAPRHQGLLNDPNWLSPRPSDRALAMLDMDPDVQQTGRSKPDPYSDSRPPPAPVPVATRPARRVEPSSGNQGTLLIGEQVSQSADQRRKEAYRRELEAQMRQANVQKARERQLNQAPPSDYPERLPSRAPPEPALRAPPPPRPPPANPNDFRGYGGPPADDPYLYYGMQNPLNGLPQTSGVGLGEVGLGPSLAGLPPSQPTKPSPRVTFADTPPQKFGAIAGRSPSDAAAAPGGFPDDELRSRSRQEAKMSYQQELKLQMEEQKRKKEAAKLEREKYDAKLEQEIRNYDPFGRGGGGAPMRDAGGNPITSRKAAPPTDADLRAMRFNNEDAINNPNRPRPSPRAAATPTSFESPTANQSSPDNPHARGGNGIFGEGLSENEKSSRATYQDDLRKQIEEKKRRDEEEKEKQRQEDQRLLKKIEDDNAKLARQLEEEQQKERQKQAEAQRQAEDLARQQHEQKQDEDRRRLEAEERRQEETRRRQEEERQARDQEQAAKRGASPPIPTMRKGDKGERSSSRAVSPPLPTVRSKTQPPSSPPVPAHRTQSRQSRVQSADVLSQLAKMRKQLQTERKRVEIDLENEKTQPEVFDPRLYNKPLPVAGPAPRSNIDVFEIARNREPVSVRRPKDPQNADEFKNLRDKKDSSSRQAFRELYPQSPLSDDALETQQRVLLAEQERDLEQLRHKGDKTVPISTAMPDMSPKALGLIRENTTASALMLDSESAFIDIPNGDQLETPGRRPNESARGRRRNRLDTPDSLRNPMGSVTSLNPDSISRKNEDRLRKLKSLTGDDISTGDPDDILARFMAKQKHNRPPSGQTLVDDSWLQSGTTSGR